MNRIRLVGGGWYDADRATRVCEEAARWNGNNHVSVATGSQWDHQALYRTASGAYVLRSWSQWQGVGETHRAISREAAARWILEVGAGELPEDLAEFATLGEV